MTVNSHERRSIMLGAGAALASVLAVTAGLLSWERDGRRVQVTSHEAPAQRAADLPQTTPGKPQPAPPTSTTSTTSGSSTPSSATSTPSTSALPAVPSTPPGTTPPVPPLTVPPSLPAGNSWDVPVPVPGPGVLPTPTPGGPPLVALTFDDGPADDTAAIAAILTENKVPATFFLVGEQIRRNPDQVRALHAAGFHLAAHSITHPRMDELTAEEQRVELVEPADEIDRLTSPGTTKCFRPPYGAWDLDTARIAVERGLAVMNWNVDSRDYRTPPAEDIARRSLAGDRPLTIVLLHDGPSHRSRTREALPAIISGFRARGALFVAIC